MPAIDKDKLFFLPVRAQLEEVEVTEQSVRAAITAALEQASKRSGADKTDTAGVNDPVGANGHPRMLQISAWICHAMNPADPQPNRNNRGFTLADLEECIRNGMWQAPFFGAIDYNHDFELYGVWYDAELKFDPKANAYGILAKGSFFSWRYTTLADKLLSIQARQGWIDVSMACMPKFYEPAKTKGGEDFLVIRHPVFFTTSVLDVEPADPHARALGAESTADTQETRAAELLKASLLEEQTEDVPMKVEEASVTTESEPVEGVAVETATEETPTAEAAADVTPEAETVEGAEVAGVEVEVEGVVVGEGEQASGATVEGETLPPVEAAAEEAAPVEPTVEVETATEEPAAETVEAPAAAVTRLTLEVQALTIALQTAKDESDTMATELATLRAFKATRDAEIAAAERETRHAARRAALPAGVAKELAKDENKDVLADMLDMDDAQWERTLKVFALASSPRKTFAERSAEEGPLSSAADKSEGTFAITRWRRRR
jgi:hypothetical protein